MTDTLACEIPAGVLSRVDGIYRSIKQLPLLGCLGVIIPFIGLLLLPIAFAYGRLKAKLLRDVESGKIIVEEHDRVSEKPGSLSTEQKLQFLRSGGNGIWVPYLIGTVWLLLIGGLVYSVVTQAR